jgi:hypothetical protein
LGLLALCLQKGDWRKILVCSGWALLAYLPMLPMTLYQFQQTKSYWSQFSMYGLVVTIATWFSGWTIDAPGVGAALIVCSLALLFAAVVRSVLRRDYAVLWLTFAPLLMVLAICPFKNVYMGRALLGCAASCCVLFAVEFTRSIRSQSLAVALVGLVLAVGVVTDRTRETVISRYASPTVAEYLRANARPGDVVRCYGSAVYMELQPYRLPVATWLDQSDDLLPFGGLSTMTISALQGGTIPPGREWIYTMRLPGFAPVIAPGARLVGAWTGAEKTFKSELYLQEETAWQH